MRFSSRTVAALGVATLSAIALTGCVASASQPSGSSAGDDSDTIILGAAMAETGFMSVPDVPAINSMRMAIDDLNEAGGIGGKQVELRVVDTGSKLEQYAPVTQQLIDDGAEVILFTCDFDLSSPGALVAEQANVLSVSPCINEALFGPKGGLNLSFSYGNSTIGEGVVMSEFANSKGWKSAAFLTDTTLKYTQSQCQYARERFTELGGTDVGDYEYVQGDSIPEIVSKIAGGTAPDVIFNCGYLPGGAQVAKDLRDGGITAPVVSGFGMDGTTWVDAIPGLKDYYTVGPVSLTGDDPDPAVNDFLERYTAEYGAPAMGTFVMGPSVIDGIAKAYDIAGTWDGAEIADAMASFTDEEFLVGETTFTPEFHIALERPQAVRVVEDGTLKFVERRAPEKINANG